MLKVIICIDKSGVKAECTGNVSNSIELTIAISQLELMKRSLLERYNKICNNVEVDLNDKT